MDSPTATQRPSAQLLTRGAYIGLGLLMLGIAVAGFWPTFFGPLLAGTLDLHWLVGAHALVFFGWLLLFLVQVVLAYRGRIRQHQALGRRVGALWGSLILVAGLLVVLGSMLPNIGTDHEPTSFAVDLLVQLSFLTAFGLLFGGGLLYRRRPEVHKRLMVLATVAIMPPAVSRFDTGLLPLFSLTYLPAFLLVAYDLWTARRIHPVTLGGTGVLLLSFFSIFVSQSEVGIQIGLWLTETARPVVETLF